MLQERQKEVLGYRVVEEKPDPGDSVIQKTGLTAEFTLNDMDRDMKYLAKKKDELEAQIAVEAARMTNIERDRPALAEMSEEERQIIYIYTKSASFVKVGKEKIAEIDTQMKEYKDEMINIVMQTGVVAPHLDETQPDEHKGNS